MTVLLDSNILIKYLKGISQVVTNLTDYIHNQVPIFVSTITIYEVYVGIVANLYLKQGRPKTVPALLKEFKQLLSMCSILDFTQKAAELAADIYAQAHLRCQSLDSHSCGRTEYSRCRICQAYIQ